MPCAMSRLFSVPVKLGHRCEEEWVSEVTRERCATLSFLLPSNLKSALKNNKRSGKELGAGAKESGRLRDNTRVGMLNKT